MVFSFAFWKKKWNPDGKHCYVTGGSAGLGLALAKLLVTKGAHVSIVARHQGRLDSALKEMEALRVSPSQILQARSADLFSASDAKAALDAMCEAHNGDAPDAVFSCAGSSKPMWFVEMTEQDLKDGMDYGYWVQAWTVYVSGPLEEALSLADSPPGSHEDDGEAEEKGRKDLHGVLNAGVHVLCRIRVVCPSKACLARYAMTKLPSALDIDDSSSQGLADTLHSELMLYDIGVQIFFPPTIYSPGYENENKTKPDVVKRIEGTDEGLTPDQAAEGMLYGFARGDPHISADFLTDLFRAGTRGATPRINFIVEAVYDFISYVGTPIWRRSVDSAILGHRQEHQQYLQEQGFFKN
ncbi:hypothetical protein NMY22_g5142 [Coprinellus aureogranulatus]|nr:hypothetical protein NMY22_g5142 [Coprinellus aureogranulatus]